MTIMRETEEKYFADKCMQVMLKKGKDREKDENERHAW